MNWRLLFRFLAKSFFLGFPEPNFPHRTPFLLTDTLKRKYNRHIDVRNGILQDDFDSQSFCSLTNSILSNTRGLQEFRERFLIKPYTKFLFESAASNKLSVPVRIFRSLLFLFSIFFFNFGVLGFFRLLSFLFFSSIIYVSVHSIRSLRYFTTLTLVLLNFYFLVNFLLIHFFPF